MRIGVAALLLAGVVACGDDDRDVGAARGAEPTAPSTTDAPEATVGQYASVISEHGPELAATIIRTGSCFDLLDYPDGCGLAERLNVEMVAIQAQTMRMVIDGLQDRDSAIYVGAPPLEIERLVERTTDALDELERHATATGECFRAAPDFGNDDCGERLLAGFAAETFASTLDAWGPYL